MTKEKAWKKYLQENIVEPIMHEEGASLLARIHNRNEGFDAGYDYGYDARDNETCECIESKEADPGWLTTSCRREIPIDSKYCAYCGRKVIIK